MSIPGPWKQVKKTTDELKMLGIRLDIILMQVLKSGNNSLFWLNYWIGNEILSIKFPILFGLEREKGCTLADSLIMVNGEICSTWGWLRTPCSGPEMVELRELLQLCQNVVLEDGNDKVGWDLDDLGDCPACGEADETTGHVFVSCSLAQAVWQAVSTWCMVPHIFAFSIRDILELYKFIKGSKRQAKFFHAVYLVSVWCLWKARNDIVFNGMAVTAEIVVGNIKALGYLWVKNRSGGSSCLGRIGVSLRYS
ncbi:uncharacterized protein LOC143588928 [Bidens hawaiensis]|uniref:uncharacterized protein LOC143588928 n=1 Tax=Bidens hawaiensis TaxID=980011 RepID=UPI00404B2745